MTKGSRNIFIVAGMPRTATTFLYYQFQNHPQLFAPIRKEMNFFSLLYSRGFDWYLSYYASMNEGQMGMDISPLYYLDAENAIPRILDFNPDIKIILGVRNAADWLISFYEQLRTQLIHPPSFEDLFGKFTIERSSKTLTLDFRNAWVPRMIELFKMAFGKNLFIYRYERFKEDPLSLLQILEKFLGIEPFFDQDNCQNLVINASYRSNVRFFSAILRNERTISLVNALVPHRWIRSLQKRRMEKSFGRQDAKRDEAMIQKAEEFFESQQKYIDHLFLKSGLLLGDGTTVSL